ncbi:MAG TPA: type II toxin-antitoxin system VapC family toxin [Terriglobales bacterium]|nr:type II toxin-antitoxin system VapC family toxin [Terriglobales bacterium]
MNGYLLDTNVVSEYARKSPPDPKVTRWVDARVEDSLNLSVLTRGEIRKGTTLLPMGDKRAQLQRWLKVDLPARFANRLLPVDADVADIWGVMSAEARLMGVALGIVDGLLAATAKHHGLTLDTRNVKDFRNSGISVFNPWDSP